MFQRNTKRSTLTAVLTVTHVQSWERDCYTMKSICYWTECFVLNLCQENISSILQSVQQHCASYMASNTHRKRAGKVATDNEAHQWIHRQNKHWVDAWDTQKAQRLRPSWKGHGELKCQQTLRRYRVTLFSQKHSHASSGTKTLDLNLIQPRCLTQSVMPALRYFHTCR